MYPQCGSSYSEVVATARYGRFLKLLGRWRYSIYKILYRDILVFLCFYYALFLSYLFVMDENSKKTYEAIVVFCRDQNSMIPLTFVMGYYVRLILKRWWDQYMNTPWPDPIAVFVSSLVYGNDSTGRIMRRTVMRYVCLCLCLVMIKISPPAQKRFGTYQKLIDAGLLLPSERDVIEKVDEKFPDLSKHWMPIVWACSILVRGRNEGRIRDDFALRTLIDNINVFRSDCHTLLQYDYVSVPLVYTQVVTLAVYMYFCCTLMGSQYIQQENGLHEYGIINYYFPIILLIEFFFFIGWLKVAEVIICPFGEDDQDFEVIWLIERNLQISYIIVDEMYHKHPELLKDQYWDSLPPDALPYPKEEPNFPTRLITGLAPMFNFNTHGRLTPQTSVESQINRRTPHDQVRPSVYTSESSSLYTVSSNMNIKVATYQRLDDGHLPIEEEMGEEYEDEHMTGTEEDDSYDLFEQLREERERARLKRPSYRLIPVALVENEQPEISTDTSAASGFTIYVSFDETATAKTDGAPTDATAEEEETSGNDEEELEKSRLKKDKEKEKND